MTTFCEVSLASLAPLAQRAYQGTSFTPEKRGATALAGYTSTLAADLNTMAENAKKGGTDDLLAAEQARYVEGYRRRVARILASESRCVSSFIAGPSNFPAQRMNKRADIAHRRGTELEEWRRVAMKAALRNLRPDLRPIMAGDDNAVDRLEAKIAQAERLQSLMVAVNKAMRASAKQGPDHQIAAMMACGLRETHARKLLKPDFAGRVGFPNFELTNNSANLRRMRERLEQITRAKAEEVTETVGRDGITMEDDPPANRVRLLFPGRPETEVRDRLKSAGFRWSPNAGAWQAYRNWRTLALARDMVGAS